MDRKATIGMIMKFVYRKVHALGRETPAANSIGPMRTPGKRE